MSELGDADVLLADGGVAHVRAATTGDEHGLLRLYGRTSDDSLRLRYFGRFPSSWDREVSRLVGVSPPDAVTLVAELGGKIVAVASYATVDHSRAEVAFLVDEEHHRRGLGSIMLEHLAAIARAHGVETFLAEVLPENESMIAVFRQIGLDARATVADSVITIVVRLGATTRSREVMEARAQSASARSIARLLNPSSIAVIGAGRQPGSTGQEVFRQILAGEFKGPVFPVNPMARHVAGVKAFPSMADIPDPVDLAFIATRPEIVADVVSDCAAHGVHAVVVLSGGFADIGADGIAAQRELVRHTRSHGMRLVGPAGMGIINTDPEVSLNGTLISGMPLRGSAAFFAQSGALSADVLARTLRKGVGISTFVSAGTRADVSVTDLMYYWISDEATSVVLLYIESLSSPRRFARVARALSRRKPVVAVNAVAAGDRRRIDTMYGQAGVIRVDSLAEMLDVAALLAQGKLPAGNRVAVITNMLSLGEIAEAACEANGLEVSGGGPTLLPIDAPVPEFEKSLYAALDDDSVDSVVSVFLTSREARETVAVLERSAGDTRKPVLPVLIGSPSSIASFGSPDEAIRALAHAVRYGRWVTEDAGGIDVLDDIDPVRALQIVDAVLERGESFLGVGDLTLVLAAYGIPTRADEHSGYPRVCIEVLNDPVFGQAVSLGLDDAVAKMLDDRSWRALPMTDLEARRLIEDVGTATLILESLAEVGASPEDLQDIVQRVGRLGERVPEVDHLRILVALGPGSPAVVGGTMEISQVDHEADIRLLPK